MHMGPSPLARSMRSVLTTLSPSFPKWVTVLSSNFAAIRSIHGIRRRGVIKLNEPFAKNQVYVAPQDRDFVYGYICTRCPQAKIG